MFPPGRPAGEVRSAQHEGTPVSKLHSVARAASDDLRARVHFCPETGQIWLHEHRMLLVHAEAQALLRIPANPEYESLNIAMAAQLIAYEIRMAGREGPQPPDRDAPLATPAEMERFYTHLETVMEEVGFRDRTQGGRNLMGRIRRLFNRSELDANEVNILRGFLTSVQSRRRRAGQDP